MIDWDRPVVAVSTAGAEYTVDVLETLKDRNLRHIRINIGGAPVEYWWGNVEGVTGSGWTIRNAIPQSDPAIYDRMVALVRAIANDMREHYVLADIESEARDIMTMLEPPAPYKMDPDLPEACRLLLIDPNSSLGNYQTAECGNPASHRLICDACAPLYEDEEDEE